MYKMYIILIIIALTAKEIESQKGYHIQIDDELPAISWKECGISDRRCDPNKGYDPFGMSTRIFNGQFASTGEFPWFANLEMHFTEFINRTVVLRTTSCGGSILNEWWVLTASHCMAHSNLTVYLRLGSITKYSGNLFESQKIIRHPKYVYINGRMHFLISKIDKTEQELTELENKNLSLPQNEVEELERDKRELKRIFNTNSYYDIALIKLKEPIVPKFNETHYIVNSVCLPKSAIVNTNQELVTASGLGKLGPDRSTPNILQKTWFWIQSTADCYELNVCQNPYKSNSGTCLGDSGSPIVEYLGCRAVIIGDLCCEHGDNISVTIGCGTYALYTRTSKHMDWIRYHIISKPNSIDKTNHFLIATVITTGVIAVVVSSAFLWVSIPQPHI